MLHLLRWLIFSLALVLFTGCKDDDDNNSVNSPARRTVLMYVSAQNSLGYRNFQELDSIEIVKGHHLIKDNDRLLVYMDDESNPRLYRYSRKKDRPELVRTWNEDVNSSSPQTLQDVLSWTKANYPAEEYGLVMWSHSDGWLPSTNTKYQAPKLVGTYSFGIDVNADGEMKYDEDKNGNVGAQMNITDMAAAIQKSGIHFKYIFFDSCLMQNLEVGYTLRHVTDYLIAAPMQIPGCGANYTHLLEKGLFTNAEYDIVDTYTTDATEGFYDKDNEYYDFGLVLSAVRTDKLEALAKTTAEVLKNSKIKDHHFVDLGKEKVLNYQAYTSFYYYRPHNFDAQEAMRAILDESDFTKFQTALNEAIVSKGATEKFWIGPFNYSMQNVDLENYSGLSIFIPQDVYSDRAANCIYGDLNKCFQETEWYKAAGWSAIGW